VEDVWLFEVRKMASLGNRKKFGIKHC